MDIRAFLTEQGLTSEEIAAVIGNEKQAKAMEAALRKHTEGVEAQLRADAEKKETGQFWESKTKELEGAVGRLTAAEKRAASESAEAARVKTYMKSLADQGYDVPKDMYEGSAAPVVQPRDGDTGKYLTNEDFEKRTRAIAPDLVALQTISNRYFYLTGEPYMTGDTDLVEAQRSGKPMREYVESKYDFSGKQKSKDDAKAEASYQDRYKKDLETERAKWAEANGSNDNLRTPLPSRDGRMQRLEKQPGFKPDSWKSREGREANRAERLKRFENIQ